MKKTCLYISFSFFLLNFSLAGQKDAGHYSGASSYAAINFNQPSLIDENENTVERRKRAHKRKRQIRPRRNGF